MFTRYLSSTDTLISLLTTKLTALTSKLFSRFQHFSSPHPSNRHLPYTLPSFCFSVYHRFRVCYVDRLLRQLPCFAFRPIFGISLASISTFPFSTSFKSAPPTHSPAFVYVVVSCVKERVLYRR